MRSGVQNDDDVVAVKGCRVNHRATSLQVLLGLDPQGKEVTLHVDIKWRVRGVDKGSTSRMKGILILLTKLRGDYILYLPFKTVV